MRLRIALASLLIALTTGMSAGVLEHANSPKATLAEEARLRGVRFERAISAMRRVLQVWLTHADQRTLLLPDRVPGPGSGLQPGDNSRALHAAQLRRRPLSLPDPHGGADRSRICIAAGCWRCFGTRSATRTPPLRFPAISVLTTGELGPPSMFGAGEYAKDGLITVTEYLGRTPWYYRMVDMVADAMDRRAGRIALRQACRRRTRS